VGWPNTDAFVWVALASELGQANVLEYVAAGIILLSFILFSVVVFFSNTATLSI
jgi:hypothetical protein